MERELAELALVDYIVGVLLMLLLHCSDLLAGVIDVCKLLLCRALYRDRGRPTITQHAASGANWQRALCCRLRDVGRMTRRELILGHSTAGCRTDTGTSRSDEDSVKRLTDTD